MKQMGVRFLLVVSMPVCLLPGNERAHAQNAPQALPPIVVSSSAPSAKPGRPKNATRTVRPPVPRLVVYPTSPIAGSGIDPDKVPASVNVVDTNQIARTGSLNIADALQQQVPGIIVNEVTGNPFQPDVQFRGFVASPV